MMSGRNTATWNTSSSSTKKKWDIDFNESKSSSGGSRSRATDSLPAPPGYSPNVQICNESQRSLESDKLVIKKSWDVALGPIKSIPMNMFIFYMSGNSISIFPIMMVGMMLMRPIKALWTVNSSFSHIEGSHILQKIVFFLGNMLQLGVALYKCQSLGLLPTHASDWLAFQEPQQQVEFAHGGLGLW